MYTDKQIVIGLTAFGLSLLSALITPAPSSAQPADDGQQGGGTPPRGLRRGFGGGLGGHGMHAPRQEDVLNLPDLTAEQKKSIQAIYDQEKTDIAPLRKQLKALGMGGPGSGGGAGPAPGGKATPGGAGLGNGQGRELMQQIHGIRKANWDKVKPLLTASQLAALKPGRPPGGPGGPGAPGISEGASGAPAGGPSGPPGDE